MLDGGRLRNFMSIRELEQLAGIGPDHASRFDFWRQFAHLPANSTNNAGVRELREIIRAQDRASAEATNTVKRN